MPRSSVRCARTRGASSKAKWRVRRRTTRRRSAKVGGSRRKRLEREKRNDESPGTANDGNEDNGETISEEYDDDDVDRTVTGVLASRETALDVKIERFSMQVNGQELISECNLELNHGRRYGLIGQNGCGKSNLLSAIAKREIPIPEHVDIYHLREEAAPSDRTALESVVDHVKLEIEKLRKKEEDLMATYGPGDERLQLIYERLEELSIRPCLKRRRLSYYSV